MALRQNNLLCNARAIVYAIATTNKTADRTERLDHATIALQELVRISQEDGDAYTQRAQRMLPQMEFSDHQ